MLHFCDWLTFLLYVVVAMMGMRVSNYDPILDLSIYTQAVDDWTTPLWQSFSLYDKRCPIGQQAIGNEWLGTVQGNYTRTGVEKTDPQWHGQIPANSSVW